MTMMVGGGDVGWETRTKKKSQDICLTANTHIHDRRRIIKSRKNSEFEQREGKNMKPKK